MVGQAKCVCAHHDLAQVHVGVWCRMLVVLVGGVVVGGAGLASFAVSLGDAAAHCGGMGRYAKPLLKGTATVQPARSVGTACTMFYDPACGGRMRAWCSMPSVGIWGIGEGGWPGVVVGSWMAVLVVSVVVWYNNGC